MGKPCSMGKYRSKKCKESCVRKAQGKTSIVICSYGGYDNDKKVTLKEQGFMKRNGGTWLAFCFEHGSYSSRFIHAKEILNF